jgi:transposase
MPKIGEDVSELLELVPAYFRVKEHHRAKYACPQCKQGVKTAHGPAKLIDKGLAAASLLAHVVVCKYDDHLPLNRLSRIYWRGGADIAVSTMVGWVAAVADELAPLYAEIKKRALQAYLVQTDASGLKVLDRDSAEGVRKGTMWCVVGDRQWVVFHDAATGIGEDGPWTLLQGRQGYIQADAANIFDRL